MSLSDPEFWYEEEFYPEQHQLEEIPEPRGGFKTLDQVAGFVAKVTDRWVQGWTAKLLHERVLMMLDKHLTSMVLYTLGIEKDPWGSWKINKRRFSLHSDTDKTHIYELIEAEAEEMFKEWVKKAMPEITKKPLPKKLIKELQQEYQKRLSCDIWDAMQNKAEEDAQLLIEQLCSVPSNELHDYVDRIRGLTKLDETEL